MHDPKHNQRINEEKVDSKQVPKLEKRKLDLSWAGSLGHLNINGMKLQDEAKKLWQKLEVN